MRKTRISIHSPTRCFCLNYSSHTWILVFFKLLEKHAQNSQNFCLKSPEKCQKCSTVFNFFFQKMLIKTRKKQFDRPCYSFLLRYCKKKQMSLRSIQLEISHFVSLDRQNVGLIDDLLKKTGSMLANFLLLNSPEIFESVFFLKIPLSSKKFFRNRKRKFWQNRLNHLFSSKSVPLKCTSLLFFGSFSVPKSSSGHVEKSYGKPAGNFWPEACKLLLKISKKFGYFC